jgi:1-aminocyclopropane-1-carboxylate deaminase/D-cysteine desulfhydrase-like pyridoxal-dependent ACC family enzyme
MLQDINLSNISIDPFSLDLFSKKKVIASVLRLDKIHPLVSGNKWFKLRYYLQEAKVQHKKTIVTFGGAWSNHILATAAACKINQLNSIGIIRGEEAATLSPTLIQAKELGMQLIFVSREDYVNKIIPPELNREETYFINEGGYGTLGAEGASTILDYCEKKSYTHICCAVGTGTMMAGIIKSTPPQQQVIGISVLKNNMGLETSVQSLLNPEETYLRIIHEYHFGGYAKYNLALIDFMNTFYQQTKIPSDFVYTGKLFYAINNLISTDFFKPGSRLLLIHSGGLQGNSSLGKGTLIF